MAKEKFATKLDKAVIVELRAYAKEAKANISDIVNDAVQNHLRVIRIRPAFRDSMAHVLKEHEALLSRLAKK